jgi:AAA family ATP:ADP antiporter
LATLLFLSFFLCLTFQYASKTVRQSTFIDALGSAQLPYVYLLVALLSLPVVYLYTRIADRFGRHQIVIGTCVLLATSLVVFFRLFAEPKSWVAWVFYVWISIALALTLSQLWSFTNHILNPRQAKRLFGFIGSGALLGGIAGGQLARVATRLLGTRHTLLAAAVLLVGVAALIHWVHLLQPAPVAPPERREKEVTQGGFSTVRRTPLLWLIALMMLLGVMVSQVVDLQFNWAVESATRGLDNRTAFYGNFFSIMGLAALVFQLVFTTRIHRGRGAGPAMKVLPCTVGAGTLLLFLAAAFMPAFLVFASLALKAGDSGLRYSLDDSTRELLFLPVSSRKRIRAKAFIDVVVKRSGKGFAAILLLPVTFGWMTALQAGWLTLGLVVAWLFVSKAASAEYVESLRRRVKPESEDDDVMPITPTDATTLEFLVGALGSPDPRTVLTSLDILAAHNRAKLVNPLLLYHDDAEVRQRTLQILAEAGREDAAPLVERLLSDPSPEVRAEAIRVLADLRHQDACVMMLPRLREPDPGARAAAIACLTNHGEEAMKRRAAGSLRQMLAEEDPQYRVEGAKTIGSVAEPLFVEELVQLLYDSETSVVRAAVEAIRQRVARDGSNPMYLPTLISLLQNRRLKHDAREALTAFGEETIPALVHFLNDTDEAIWVRRAIPKTIARLGTAGAVESLVECLHQQSDPFLRRKLIESLAVAGRQIVGARDKNRVRLEIRREAEGYLSVLAELFVLDSTGAAVADGFSVLVDSDEEDPNLLERLLEERLREHRKNLFGLLALLHERRPIWDVYRGLESGRPNMRAHALEYLDNTLSGSERRDFFAAIGDQPLEEKLEEAGRLYGITTATKVETLRRFLTAGGDRDSESPFFAVAALYLIRTDRITALYPVVEEVGAAAPEGFVKETAMWVVGRWSVGDGSMRAFRLTEARE